MTTSQAELAQVRRRSEVSTLFIGFLVGIAISEAIGPVKQSLNDNGFSIASVALFAVFLMTVVRFFIGFQLHLMDEKLLSMNGNVWFFDFSVIVFETIILIFMAGVCTVEESAVARYKFVQMLVWLLAADVVWAVLQQIASWSLKGWKRRVLWGWGLSGLGMIGLITLVGSVTGNIYSRTGLIALVIMNVLAFFLDLKLIDHYGLFRRNH